MELKKQRSDVKSRNSVTAEAYGIFNKHEDFTPKVIEKTDEEKENIKACMKSCFMFSNLDDKDLSTVIDAMEKKDFEADCTVIVQGENGNCLYLIQSGNLDCFKETSGENKLVRTYSLGEAFGELALLYNSPRAATLVTTTSCILWALDRETFNHIVKDAAVKKRERYETFLKSVEILSGMDTYEISQISDALKNHKFKAGEYIIKQGDIGDNFYIVEEGEAYASKVINEGEEEQHVMEYLTGGYFGELALLKNECRNANVIAKVLVIFNLRLMMFGCCLWIDFLLRGCLDRLKIF
jgi:cAMP-dependent protein kinase regulator